MKGIYSFYEDCCYGSLEGLFVADSDDIAKIVGKEIYFGECLGKHSEVVVEIEEKNFTLKTQYPEHVDWFEKLKLYSGFNPFDYYDIEEDKE